MYMHQQLNLHVENVCSILRSKQSGKRSLHVIQGRSYKHIEQAKAIRRIYTLYQAEDFLNPENIISNLLNDVFSYIIVETI